MQDRFSKYFWDGLEQSPNPMAVRRIFEYASFEDMVKYPFENVKKFINEISLDKLWTGEHRKLYLKGIKPFIKNSSSWEEAHMKMVKNFAKNFHFTNPNEEVSEMK